MFQQQLKSSKDRFLSAVLVPARKYERRKAQYRSGQSNPVGDYVRGKLTLPRTGDPKYDGMRMYASRRCFIDSHDAIQLPSTVPGDYPGVYALDCEMVTTTLGQELVRISILDTSFKVVYDEYVKPVGKVTDYHTEITNITEEDLLDATTTLSEVQRYMKQNFSSKTIFVGHDLRNDFSVLNLNPGTVVDTASVFRYKDLYPNKISLKELTRRQLKMVIQEGHHDSVEDAGACMAIVLRRVRINSAFN